MEENVALLRDKNIMCQQDYKETFVFIAVT